MLKQNGKRVQYQRNIVNEMLSLDVHNTQGMEFDLCQITGRVQAGHLKEDANEKCVLHASWFKQSATCISRVGGMQEWSCPSEAEYICPPHASIRLSRLLFMENEQCNSTDRLYRDNRRSGWMDNNALISGTAWHQEDPSGACAIGMHLAKNHEESFTAVAKDVLGLQTTNTKGTIECKAMIQYSNITINQPVLYCSQARLLHHK
jgi:hypothetical protein